MNLFQKSGNFYNFSFSTIQIWGLRVKRFSLQFLIDIFPLGIESVDPHIFNCGSGFGSRKPVSCGSNGYWYTKHWFIQYKYKKYIYPSISVYNINQLYCHKKKLWPWCTQNLFRLFIKFNYNILIRIEKRQLPPNC